jgi:hypothetical protein
MKKFDVTFTKPDKYNPVTRTIQVKANDEYHAKYLTHSEHGSFAQTIINGLPVMNMRETPTDKIKIEKVAEIKEEKEGKN